jgi:hypothetical protein
MPDNAEIPSPSALDAPGGRHSGDAARAWQRAAHQSIAHQLTQVITTCAQAAELLSTTTATDTPAPGSTETTCLLDSISTAEQALDAAHELAYQASDPSEAHCAACGEPIGILASSGTQWQHLDHEPDPASGQRRTKIRAMGHPPVPEWRSRPRPAIVAGRLVPAQEPSCP